MPDIPNDVFKMISLRGVSSEETLDPTEGIDATPVVERLTVNPANPFNASDETLDAISHAGVFSLDQLKQLSLWPVSDAVETKRPQNLKDFLTLAAGDDDRVLFDDYSAWEKEYSSIVDSWMVGVLRRRPFCRHEHENLIRVGRLWRAAYVEPQALRFENSLIRLLTSRLVFPPALVRSKSKTVATKSNATKPVASLDAAKKKYSNYVAKIEATESIQRKASSVYWLQKSAKTAAPQDRRRRARGRIGGLFSSISSTLFGVPMAKSHRSMAQPMSLDDEFFTTLRGQLSDGEEAVLDNRLATRGGQLAVTRFDDLLSDVLGTNQFETGANDACQNIRLLEEMSQVSLPQPREADADSDRPSVRAIGWGDLIVARERLVGYEAKEIAHIENILLGETKVRTHIRSRKNEETIETETRTEEEKERDLQTTDRHELQAEVSTTIDENFSVKAGVNTSGRYGLTKVDTSLDVGFDRNSTEARSTSVALAKEVIARTVERVFESVRQLRRQVVTETVEEKNKHTLENKIVAGDGTLTSISGVYKWVQKIQEVELRQYGARLMVEFHIPEPGLSLFAHNSSQKTKIPKPAPFLLGPSQVTVGNYLCLTRAYGARDVQPPPAQYEDVGYTWRSTPDEGTDGDKAEETVADFVILPDGYRPVSGTASITALPIGNSDNVYLYVAIGGMEVVEIVGYSDDAELKFEYSSEWPEGMPVSLLAHGHWDKTLVLHVAIRCQRTSAAIIKWQLQTWERIREAYEVKVQEYESSVLEAEADAGQFNQIVGRPPEMNRVMEKDELKKWSIKVMRAESFTDELVNSVVQVGEHAEIDPVAADFQAPIVRFFEEAFEWREISYFLYPYFWGRRNAWNARLNLDGTDPIHDQFLRAGACRVIAPVTPGYEERVLNYLDSDPSEPEIERIQKPAPGEIPDDSGAADLWLDLLTYKNAEVALGSGTLDVTKNSLNVSINSDGNWEASDRDLGRELYIAGDRYLVDSIISTSIVSLDRGYQGDTNPAAKYATGSVPYGPPWLVYIPTNLVILQENESKLS